MIQLQSAASTFELKSSIYSQRAKALVEQRARYLADSSLIIDPDPIPPYFEDSGLTYDD